MSGWPAARVWDSGGRTTRGTTGGVAESGDASELMVIKYGTSQWVEPDETALEAGDKIWVPQKKVREFEYYFALIRDFFAVAATIATTVLLYYSTQK